MINGGRRSNRRSGRSTDAIKFAREQRKGANEFAQRMWQIVRDRRCRGLKIRREHPIPPYAVDFCCVSLKLVIEVDGEPHLTEEGRRHDEQRDRFLAEQGFQVIRFPGYEVVRDPVGVRGKIEEAIDERVREFPSDSE